MTLLEQEAWTRWPSVLPSNPNRSVILWSACCCKQIHPVGWCHFCRHFPIPYLNLKINLFFAIGSFQASPFQFGQLLLAAVGLIVSQSPPELPFIWVHCIRYCLSLGKKREQNPFGTNIAMNSPYAANWAGLEGLNVPRTLWQYCSVENRRIFTFLALIWYQTKCLKNLTFSQERNLWFSASLPLATFSPFQRETFFLVIIFFYFYLVKADIIGIPPNTRFLCTSNTWAYQVQWCPEGSWIKPWWWVAVHNTSKIQSLWFMTTDMTKILSGSEEWWLMCL